MDVSERVEELAQTLVSFSGEVANATLKVDEVHGQLGWLLTEVREGFARQQALLTRFEGQLDGGLEETKRLSALVEMMLIGIEGHGLRTVAVGSQIEALDRKLENIWRRIEQQQRTWMESSTREIEHRRVEADARGKLEHELSKLRERLGAVEGARKV